MVQPSKTERWLDLLAFLLQHRYPVTREQIYQNVAGYGDASESTRRKFERDKDDLRALGINIETVRLPDTEGDEPASGYRLKARDFYLPYLELSESGAAESKPYQLAQLKVSRDDVARLDRATQRIASLTNVALSQAAASARRKLGFDLPLSVGSVERVLERPLAPEGVEALEVLQQAVAARTAVTCRYFAIGRDAEEDRVIEPYGLFFSWGRWYCVARSRERQALRVFRVDRMRQARLAAGADATFEVPANFNVRAYLGRAPWELSDAPETTVRVRFPFPESRWVLSRGTGRAVEPVLDDGGSVIEFRVRDTNPFLRWLLTFGDRIGVLAPASVAHELAALSERVAQLYAGDRA